MEPPRVREFLVNRVKQRTRLTASSQAFFNSVTLELLTLTTSRSAEETGTERGPVGLSGGSEVARWCAFELLFVSFAMIKCCEPPKQERTKFDLRTDVSTKASHVNRHVFPTYVDFNEKNHYTNTV